MFRTVQMEEKKSSPKTEGTVLKRTELPVYSETPQSTPERNEEVGNEHVFRAVQLFRSEGCKVMRTAQSVLDRCSKFVNTGISHTQSNYQTTVEYLHEERNILPRIGAIGGGILLGYVFGIRKGLIKRMLYTAAGGVTIGAVCYPKEAEEYFKQSSHLSKKYLIISYHFLNGVTKDLGGFELPTLPLKTLTQDPQESAKKDEN